MGWHCRIWIGSAAGVWSRHSATEIDWTKDSDTVVGERVCVCVCVCVCVRATKRGLLLLLGIDRGVQNNVMRKC